MRLIAMAVGLAVLLAIPFLLWGDWFEEAFSAEGTTHWLERQGSWAWAAAIGLLAADLVLPLPATVVLAALGLSYGVVLGGLIGSVGSMLAGGLAYGLCRLSGPRAARFFVSREELERGQLVFDRVGVWAVALSRWLPLFPEVIACLAGLVRMPAHRFFAALACGSIPMAFAFAAMGALGSEHPAWALASSALVPALLWPIVGLALRRSSRRAVSSEARGSSEITRDVAKEPR